MRRLQYILISMLVLFIACSPDVQLCYDEHPHRAYIDFYYDWSKTADFEERDGTVHPDSMRVIAYRRVNTLKYLMMTTAKESGNTGYIILPGNEVFPIEERENETCLWLHNGEYEMMTYNGTSDILEEKPRSFFQTNEMESDSIIVKYKMYPYVDRTPLLARYIRWVDSNPYSGFIISGNEPLYCAKTTISVPIVHGGYRVACHFTPTMKSQKVNVIFTINPKEEGIIIDSLHAEMGGVGAEMVLGTGVVNINHTGKVLFRPECAATEEEGALEARGCFYATGIVQSSSTSKIVGPGILQLNVYARITEEQDGKMVTRRKTFRASINLYHTLTECPSLVYDQTVKGFVQSAPEITLRIEDVLAITREKILSTPSAQLDYWEDTGAIYLDI